MLNQSVKPEQATNKATESTSNVSLIKALSELIETINKAARIKKSYQPKKLQCNQFQ